LSFDVDIHRKKVTVHIPETGVGQLNL